jgi:hypothetical protein
MLPVMGPARRASIGSLERRPPLEYAAAPVPRGRAPRTVLLGLMCAALLLSATRAFANGRVSGDFDGDGIGDYGSVSTQDPTIVRIWLSSTNRMAVIHSREPVLQLAAADVDGDSRSDLVARVRSSLRVWVRKDGRFHRYRVRPRIVNSRFTRTRNHAGNADPLCAELNATEYSLVSPSLHSTVLTMMPVLTGWIDLSHPVRGPTSGAPVFPFTPRPPPASAL